MAKYPLRVACSHIRIAVLVSIAGLFGVLATAQTPTGPLKDPDAVPLQRYAGALFELSYPTSWQLHESPDSVVFAPPGGLAQTRAGVDMRLGLLVSHSKAPGEKLSLQQYTDAILKSCCEAIPGYRKEHQEMSKDPNAPQAMQTIVSGNATSGGKEASRLLTMRLPEGFLLMQLTVPAGEFNPYSRLFFRMLGTLRLLPALTSASAPTGGQTALPSLDAAQSVWAVLFSKEIRGKWTATEDARYSLTLTPQPADVGDPSKGFQLEGTYTYEASVYTNGNSCRFGMQGIFRVEANSNSVVLNEKTVNLAPNGLLTLTPKESLYGQPSPECAAILRLAEKERNGYPSFRDTQTYPVSWDQGVLRIRDSSMKRDDRGYTVLDGSDKPGFSGWGPHSTESFMRITRENLPSFKR